MCRKRPLGLWCRISCCQSRPWLLSTSLIPIPAKNFLLQTSVTLPGAFFWLREHVSPEPWQATLNQLQAGDGGQTAQLPCPSSGIKWRHIPPTPLLSLRGPGTHVISAGRCTCYCLSSLPCPIFHHAQPPATVLPGVSTSQHPCGVGFLRIPS